MGIIRAKIIVSNSYALPEIQTDRRLTAEGVGSYNLYSNNGFSPIPKGGDVTGLVAHVVTQARKADSGVISLRVTSHAIVIDQRSQAVPATEHVGLLQAAIRTAGLPFKLV